jgi:hypothetical protein
MMYDAEEFMDSLFGPADLPAIPDIVPDDLPSDWREWYEERLSIMWECGGPMPAHLTVVAMADTLAAMRRAGESPNLHRRLHSAGDNGACVESKYRVGYRTWSSSARN